MKFFNFFKESGKRTQLESLISNLNNEIDKLKQLLKECLENNRLNRDDIKVVIGSNKIYFEKKIFLT